MLTLVMFHAFMGMRTSSGTTRSGGAPDLLLDAGSTSARSSCSPSGTIVLVTLPNPVPAGAGADATTTTR